MAMDDRLSSLYQIALPEGWMLDRCRRDGLHGAGKVAGSRHLACVLAEPREWLGPASESPAAGGLVSVGVLGDLPSGLRGHATPLPMVP